MRGAPRKDLSTADASALYKAIGGGWVVEAERMTNKDSQHSDIGRKPGESVAELPR